MANQQAQRLPGKGSWWEPMHNNNPTGSRWMPQKDLGQLPRGAHSMHWVLALPSPVT